ncbi:MAG TPA: LptF/LptG family permease [Cytophagaceae bacterium]
MKKLDKLIVKAFLGPFFLTFVVVVFILLTQYLLKYLEDFVGKDLGLAVFSELIFYFSINMVPTAMPLAILLSSLMTYGNLGEHHELTAIKSAGISLTRTLIPIFLNVLILTGVAFYFNNNMVPKANLKAYSLLYDIRQKKLSFDLKEGAFYNGLPGYSIKVTKKLPDGVSLKGVMVYNHTSGRGNSEVIIADSGKLSTFAGDKYLKMTLFNGKSYSEYVTNTGSYVSPKQFVRNDFERSEIVFSLASFDLNRTKEELFAGNKLMKNVSELQTYVDSVKNEYNTVKNNLISNIKPFYLYNPIGKATNDAAEELKADKLLTRLDSLPALEITEEQKVQVLNRAVNQARSVKAYMKSHIERLNFLTREANVFEIEEYKKYTQSIACLIMFLIGAPLGAIIKKGGLGVPVLISIIFFITFYVISLMGEKWAKEGVVDVPYGMWAANLILLPIGLFFLRQAKNDSRLLETDFYSPVAKLVRKIFGKGN